MCLAKLLTFTYLLWCGKYLSEQVLKLKSFLFIFRNDEVLKKEAQKDLERELLNQGEDSERMSREESAIYFCKFILSNHNFQIFVHIF